MVFESRDSFLAVLERKDAAAAAASPCTLKDHGILCERLSDLLEPCVGFSEDNQVPSQDGEDSHVSNLEIGYDGLVYYGH